MRFRSWYGLSHLGLTGLRGWVTRVQTAGGWGGGAQRPSLIWYRETHSACINKHQTSRNRAQQRVIWAVVGTHIAVQKQVQQVVSVHMEKHPQVLTEGVRWRNIIHSITSQQLSPMRHKIKPTRVTMTLLILRFPRLF